MPDQDPPKIHIDDDWKTQAQREKERLSEKVEEDQARPRGPVSFADLVNLLATQAAVGLGGMRTPDGRTIPPSLELAKDHIDMLEMLEAKTASNLTDEEKRLLDTTLMNLRMAYVDAVEHRSGPGAGTPGR
jgi:hypothetical protein